MKERSLGGDWLFWACLGFGVLIAAVSVCVIVYNDNLIWCGSYSCFKYSLEVFSFPIQAFSAGLALAALRGIVFRSHQTAKQIIVSNNQIDLVKKQNLFKNYFDHKSDFSALLDKLERTYEVRFRDKHMMYSYLFPLNSPVNFDAKSKGKESENSPLEYWIERYNLVISRMNSTSGLLDTGNSILFIFWLRELVAVLDKIAFSKEGRKVSSLHDKRNCFTDMPEWNNFPAEIYAGVQKITLLFEVLVEYCLPKESDFKVLELTVIPTKINEMLEYVCGDFEIE